MTFFRSVLRTPRFLKNCAAVLLGLFLIGGLVFSQKDKGSPSKTSSKGAAPALQTAEKGSFRILRENSVVGQEEYEIQPSENYFIAKAKINLDIEREERTVKYVLEPQLTLRPNFELLKYFVATRTSEGSSAKLEANFEEEKISAQYQVGPQSETREFVLSNRVALLDNNVFHHFVILMKRYDFDRGGLQSFAVFVPQEAIAGDLTVDDKGEKTITVNGASMATHQYVVDTGDVKIDLFLDAQHRLIKISVPTRQVEVIRQS